MLVARFRLGLDEAVVEAVVEILVSLAFRSGGDARLAVVPQIVGRREAAVDDAVQEMGLGDGVGAALVDGGVVEEVERLAGEGRFRSAVALGEAHVVGQGAMRELVTPADEGHDAARDVRELAVGGLDVAVDGAQEVLAHVRDPGVEEGELAALGAGELAGDAARPAADDDVLPAVVVAVGFQEDAAPLPGGVVIR